MNATKEKKPKRLKENENKKDSYSQIRKRQLTSLRHRMWRENLILTGYKESKRYRGKQQINYVTNLCKWFAEQRFCDITKIQTLLVATNKRSCGAP